MFHSFNLQMRNPILKAFVYSSKIIIDNTAVKYEKSGGNILYPTYMRWKRYIIKKNAGGKGKTKGINYELKRN